MDLPKNAVILLCLTCSLLPNRINFGTISAINFETSVDQRIISLEKSEVNWNQTYGGRSTDEAYALIQTKEGGLALAGYTWSYGAGFADMWLVRTDLNGVVQWSRTYGHQLVLDQAHALIQSNEGGYVLAGYTQSYDESVDKLREDLWLVKTNATGGLQWNLTYGESLGFEEAFALIQTSDEGYVIAGHKNFNFLLLKVDLNGIKLWNQTYGKDISRERAYCLIQTIDGGFALAGYKRPFGGEEDIWFVKTNMNGELQWNQTYGGPGDELAEVLVETRDKGYAFAGYTTSFGAGKKDMWLVKTDAQGIMQWNQTYGRAGDEGAKALLQTKDGGYALAGYTSSYGAGKWDMWLIKTDAAGNIQWNQTFGGPENDHAKDLLQTKEGNFVLAGSTRSYGAGGLDMWLVKIQGTKKQVIKIPPHVFFGSLLFFGISLVLGVLIIYQRKKRH
ncbi:MAG: hypothetical protein JSW11_01530 [Candidatus Heimdallarchaeota archaeon]|nr:MAG: hypothetical protein JSW11_01530 [Candidatus Heimdallarchaeota archaeon]